MRIEMVNCSVIGTKLENDFGGCGADEQGDDAGGDSGLVGVGEGGGDAGGGLGGPTILGVAMCLICEESMPKLEASAIGIVIKTFKAWDASAEVAAP